MKVITLIGLGFLLILGVQILIALVVQWLWLQLAVPQGAEPMSLFMAWLVAFVVSAIFKAAR